MEITQNILLNSSKNKKETNENTSLNVAFFGNKKLLPEDAINASLNSYEVYLDERKKSNKFRLVVNINPYCSNVLFNPFTEIVKNEGSADVICLNYENVYREKKENIIGKSDGFVWNQYEAIRDTQLSNEACGFEYHCGIDIFNNHVLRNKTFKAINYDEEKSIKEYGKLDKSNDGTNNYGDNYKKVKVNDKALPHVYVDNSFNTIDDYMRDKDGVIISEHFPKIVKKTSARQNIQTVILPLHLYQNYDIYTFRECIREKLLDDNGWYGFSNPSTLSVTTLKEGNHKTSEGNIDASKLDINKTINNKEYCDYIDMYPGRDLYSFAPKYNKKRKRLEKNWNYCLTYPSKNVVKNGDIIFPFFNVDISGNTSLKVYMFDEGTIDDDGAPLVTIYTICQHGLMVGDTVNIYKSGKIFYDSVEVVNVVDKYIFQIYKSDGNMSEHWVEVENRRANNTTILNPFTYIQNDTVITPKPQIILNGVLRVENRYYPICESNRCNVDPNAQDISIRRVVNGVECKYYVRKFSRLPNFKFKNEEINDYTLYDDKELENNKKRRRIDDSKLTLIERFSKPNDPSCEFESHISKLGFANTSYGDDTVEIVFTDDIDVSYLRDNLGRPLSDIYITIVKNNKGYKEWYGIGKNLEINNINVEYSHCFGKVNSSFLLSDYYREYYNNSVDSFLYDVRDITADPSKQKGLKKKSGDTFTDEIEFDKDWEYYGDICCYSPVDCDEQVIQTAMHRFNTVQRELSSLNSAVYDKFNGGKLFYNEIYDVENTLLYSKTNGGDPYTLFKNGSKNPIRKKDITSFDEKNLYHTTKEYFENMLNFKEGYYYQPHYKIPFKTVSSELKADNAIKYEISKISDNYSFTENGRSVFEIKTSLKNEFCKNEKMVLYKKSSNDCYFITVYELIDLNTFTCVINDESGNSVSYIEGFLDIENINDYILVKKHDETPDYAKLIKDGSCRYLWRDVLSNGIENDKKIYPFTNNAFYINKRINFFLRRQDPNKYNLGFVNGNQMDFVPNGEYEGDFYDYYETNYEANEIEQC